MRARGKPPLMPVLLVFALVVAACGGRRPQKTSTPTLAPNFETPSPVVELIQPAAQPTDDLGAGSPSGPPSEDGWPALDSSAFHYPPARRFEGRRPYQIGLLTGAADPYIVTLVGGARQAAANLGV